MESEAEQFHYVFTWRYVPAMLTSTLGFYILCEHISPAWTPVLLNGYKNLNAEQTKEWHSRVNSNVHALITGLGSFYLLFDQCINKDPDLCDSPLLRTLVAILIGYSIIDIWLILWRSIGDLSFVYHHVAAMYSYAYVVMIGILPWYGNLRLLAELSTPFVNQRWFLDVLGYGRTSTAYVINGLLMVVVFFLCRVMLIPFYWYYVISALRTPAWKYLTYMPYIMMTCCFVLDVLNLYWFKKMMFGAVKILSARFAGDEERAKRVKTE